jgi:hypothetical protein
MDSGLIGLGAVILFVVLFLSSLAPNTRYKCRKCGFTTDDELRAKGHVAIENAHACDQI